MGSINKACLSGHLGADARLSATAGGTDVLGWRMAVTSARKGQGGGWEEETSWVPCVLYGPRARALAPLMSRGRKVAVSGELRERRWERDGQRHSVLELVAREVDLMSAPRGAAAAPSAEAEGRGAEEIASALEAAGATVYDDEIPF